MNKSMKFSPEVRRRAVRMVQEHRGEYPSLWATLGSIASKIGCVPQTLLEWIKRHEVDTGVRGGVPTAEAQLGKELEREVKELRRANESLKLADAFFVQAEIDRRLKRCSDLVDEHRPPHGVEPICKVLQVASWRCRRHAARRSDRSLLSPRAQRDVS